MVKFGSLFIFLLVTLLSVSGCPRQAAQPKRLKTPETVLAAAQSAETKPIEAAPQQQTTEAQSEPADPAPAETEVPQPQTAGPGEPNKIEPAEQQTPTPQPNDITPVELEIEQTSVPDSTLDQTEVIEPEPNEPNNTETVQIELPQTEPETPATGQIAAFLSEYTEILNTYVTSDDTVDYHRLRQKRTALKNLLKQLDQLDPNEYNSWDLEERTSFWINAYNLQMLNIIMQNYPIESSRLYRLWWPPTSIRHIPPVKEVGTAKWNGYKFMVTDEQFTLTEVEQRFLINEFGDPRVFFALSHATLSGPPLRSEPYTGEKLNDQLDDQVRRFLTDYRAFRIDREKNVVHISVIFHPTWHGNQFLPGFATDKKFKDHPPVIRSVLNFITSYVSSQDTSFLQTGNYSVEYIKYDWRLNE